jgi:hypothetical protein
MPFRAINGLIAAAAVSSRISHMTDVVPKWYLVVFVGLYMHIR